jgi:hypothetical protein
MVRLNLLDRVANGIESDVSYMLDTPRGAYDKRSIMVEVLEEHEGTRWNTIGEPAWKCSCMWEGDDHFEHVADMYEEELSQRQKGK